MNGGNTALLAGLSLGQYLTYQLDFASETEAVIKQSKRCHYIVYSTLALSTKQSTPISARPNLEGFSCADLLWTHINQKFGLANALFVRYQQQLFIMRADPGADPTPVLTAMLNLQGKINGNKTPQVVLDSSVAAAMLGALSDAVWSVEKAVMKDKGSSLSPSVIIAKCQVDWPGKDLHKSVGNINFAHGHNIHAGLLTPPPLFTDIAGTALAILTLVSLPLPSTSCAKPTAGVSIMVIPCALGAKWLVGTRQL